MDSQSIYILLPIQCGHVYSFLAIFFQEGKEKRKESKKDHSDENEEEIQKAPEEVKKKSTGGFTKSMHKTFGQKFSPKGKRNALKKQNQFIAKYWLLLGDFSN